MLRDIFYFGSKPNVHPRERPADNIDHARSLCTTEHFWIINEFCDYTNFDWDFDFDFLPDEDVWAQDHNNVWPSIYQKDSGTWLCSSEDSSLIIYRNDVIPLRRKNIKTDNWVLLDKVDETKFDFGWHPDPTDPPYIYRWGNKFYPVELNAALEYHVPDATQVKYMSTVVELLPEYDRWVENYKIDKNKFDLSWRPNPIEPPMIYIWGNKYVPGETESTLEYHVPGATEKKFMSEKLELIPVMSNWEILDNIDKNKFDFSWIPDPTSPPYIYAWGNQWNKPEDKISVQFVVPGATEYKYMDARAIRKPCMDNWIVPDNVDTIGFDFSWIPNPNDPPYIYVSGTQHQKTGGPRYVVKDAIDIKYINAKVKALPTTENWHTTYKIKDFDYSWHPDTTEDPYIYVFGNNLYPAEDCPTIIYTVSGATQVKYINDIVAILEQNIDNWYIPDNVDTTNFDFSWIPNPNDPPYIYVAGTQHQKTGGPRYVVEGATEVKYINFKATALPSTENWHIVDNDVVDTVYVDYSWHPDSTEEPYIYVFGNQYYSAETMPTVEYHVPGATQRKYMSDNIATIKSKRNNWIIPNNIAYDGEFDFNWIPNPNDPPYIYQYATQWQKTGGIRYVVEGATEVKYVDIKTTALPTTENWQIANGIKIKEFDYSWHPDTTEDPYIYVFGNNLYTAEDCPTIIYTVPGATEIKYVNDIIASLGENKDSWYIPDNVDTTDFDFSWIPNPNDPPYIYVSGTQHQKTGGPRYVVEGATEIKYIDFKVKALPTSENWTITEGFVIDDFDYSWHPDTTEDPYIYVFGNNLYPATECPTIRYSIPGATEIKYVNDIVATLGENKNNWFIPDNVDATGFDFSWIPNPTDPPYIYVCGTQWQKTGGPRYVVEGATEIKYIDFKVTALPNSNDVNWCIVNDNVIREFDYSWHPDTTEDPYIYIFGNNLYPANECPTIEYVVPGATQIKYVNDIVATLGENKNNWFIPDNVDATGFDFSWIPNPKDPPYIYVSGTQWQKTGGPRYVVDNATEIKYIDFKVTALPNSNDVNWCIVNNNLVKDFDYSWHPDTTEDPYIYVFGNNLYPAQECPTVEYRVPGATEIKYINDIVATLGENKNNWFIPDNVDTTNFDFSWIPNPKDPPYVYVFGTQWQKTNGPRYIVENATELKYIDSSKAIALPDKTNFIIPDNVDVSDFDFSWHPDATESPYVYQFGTQWQRTGGPQYIIEGATEIKYVDSTKAKALPVMSNWHIPENVDISTFDFSWHPDSEEKPYIYQFGTQWQKTGGPRYMMTGAIEIKYIEGNKSKKLPDMSNWIVPKNININEFDFSWHPDATESPYIYQFGTQWQKTGGPKYVTPNATQIKYVSDIKAKALPDGSNWEIPDDIIIDIFDFSWHPDDTEDNYIYQFGTQHQKTGGPRYIDASAKNKNIVYVDRNILKAIKEPSKKNWFIPDNIDTKSVDYTWHPDDTEEPYIYEFGTQWNDRGGPKYIVPGAEDYKYSKAIIGKTLPSKTNWKSLLPIDEENFDYTWVPHPYDPPYVYVFGNQWNRAEIEPTIIYEIEGATELKYIHKVTANALPVRSKWTIMHKIDEDNFDFSWRPNPKDPPYNYVFGNQYYTAEKMPTLVYHVEEATDYKYVDDIRAKIVPNMDNWKELILIDKEKFDFSWIPDPGDPPYIYVFGNQWHSAEEEPTLEYHVLGATTRKYISEIKAYALPDMKRWEIPEGIKVRDFDFTWRPDPGSPPYIYQFGTLVDDNDGPRYISVDTNNVVVRLNRVYKTIIDENEIELPKVEIEETIQKYFIKNTLQDLINEHPTEIFWAMRETVDYSTFNFDWRPSIEQARYVHVFGVPDYEFTQTYFVSAPMYRQGYTDLNYVEPDKKVDESITSLLTPNDMFFVDRGNNESKERYEKLKHRYPHIQKTRFLNTWVDTINRCINRSNTELCWILNSEYDYSNFNFNYFPTQWQMNMVHVFGTQWNHWGHTYIVNRETFSNDTKYIKIIEHLSNLNFVKDRRANATNNLYDMWIIDHGNDLTKVKETLERKSCGKSINIIAYDTNYLTTFRNLVTKLPEKKEDYIWLCSSICDYSNFDFSYTVDPFAKDNLHVFSSDKQKFGDTFFVDVNKTKEVIDSIDKLQAYPKINYNNTLRAARLPAPIIDVDNETLVGSLNVEYDFPYAVFQTEHVDVVDQEPISLWSDDMKTITVTSTGATRIIVPKEAKDIVKNELYDYPYIKTASKLGSSKPMDIVFLSNGEQCADENYKHLLAVTKHTKNRVVRVDGIDGRVAAYHAAVEASNTPWAFTVFAKLKVNSKFDWGWQPDRMQIPKHYIFHAKNPVNGLEYGHQGMIAYNKKLTLANQGKGLDFTLDDPHETVKLLSGTAVFNTDPYATWRTAFREVIKLQSDYSDIASERLNTWTTVAEGEFAEYCLQGAKDAVEFYDSVMGDIDELKKSYEWEWLKEFYRKKYR